MSAAVVVAAATSFIPAEANAAIAAPVTVTPVGQQAINAVFNVTRFATQTVDGVQQLVAIGTLTTTVNGATQVIADLAIPVTSISGACPILHLDLGPLHLTLLGLNVDLSAIHLDITAVAGQGNLLGNLLCTVAGLLDQNPGNLQRVVGLLNNILNSL